MRLTIEERDEEVAVFTSATHDGPSQLHGAPTPFVWPLDQTDLEDLRFYLEQFLQLPTSLYEARALEIEQQKIPAWGHALFRAVFGPTAAAKERRAALDGLHTAAGRGEETQILIASSNPRFLALPWELLCEPNLGAPLAFKVTSFDRTLNDIDQDLSQPDASEGIRLLVVIARPEGIDDVPFQSIGRRLFSQIAELGGRVQAEVLRPATFDAFERKIFGAAAFGRPFHIVHFDGHGTFGSLASTDDATAPQRGFLSFEHQDRSNSPDFISAARFAAALRKGHVPCVILNACQSAMLEAGATAKVDSAIATKLLSERVASVVAMSHLFYVAAADVFMTEFYSRLFAGDTASVAVGAARRALADEKNAIRTSFLGDRQFQDWMVPHHYSRAPLRFAAPSQSITPPPRPMALLGPIKSRDARLLSVEPDGGVFIGRDAELLSLDRALTGTHLALLTGPIGSGKTELAKALARWFQLSGAIDDPSYVFFQTFEPRASSYSLNEILDPIFEALASLRPDWKVTCDTPKKREDAVLLALQSDRCLVVLDGFEAVLGQTALSHFQLDQLEQEHIRRFLKAAKQSSSSILISSRSREAWLMPSEIDERGAFLASEDIAFISLAGLEHGDDLAFAKEVLASTVDLGHPNLRDELAVQDLLVYLAGNPGCLRALLPQLQRHPATVLLGRLRSDFWRLAEDGRAKLLLERLSSSLGQLSDAERSNAWLFSIFERSFSARQVFALTDPSAPSVLNEPHAALPERMQSYRFMEWVTLESRLADLGLLRPTRSAVFFPHPALSALLRAGWREAAGESYIDERNDLEAAVIAATADCAIDLRMPEDDDERSEIVDNRDSFYQFMEAAFRRKLFGQGARILETLNGQLWMGGAFGEEAFPLCKSIFDNLGGESQPPEVDSTEGRVWRILITVIAEYQRKQGDFDAAERAYGDIVLQAQGHDSTNAHFALASAYGKIAEFAIGRHEWPRAEHLLRIALDVWMHHRKLHAAANVLRRLAVVAQGRSNLAHSEWYLTKAEELDSDGSSDPAHFELGIQAQQSHDLDTAEAHYAAALEIASKADNKTAEMEVVYQLGMVAQHRQNYDEAERLYNQYLVFWERNGDADRRIRIRHQLGMLASFRGDLRVAADWYYEAIAVIGEKGGNLTDGRLTATFMQLALTLEQMGDLDKAFKFYRACLSFSLEAKDLITHANAWAGLGRVEWARKNIEKAIECCVKAVYHIGYDEGEFPSRRADGAVTLAELTLAYGEPRLEKIWTLVVGEDLPDHVRSGIRGLIKLIHSRPRADPVSDSGSTHGTVLPPVP